MGPVEHQTKHGFSCDGLGHTPTEWTLPKAIRLICARTTGSSILGDCQTRGALAPPGPAFSWPLVSPRRPPLGGGWGGVLP